MEDSAMKDKKLVAIYARVSTLNKGQDPQMQLRELRDYSRKRGWKVYEEYVDKGISGAKDSRPALDRLMVDARKRKFDVSVVWKFDSFARSVSHLLKALETFGSLGIEFVSLSEQIDTSTSTGKMIFTVLGAVAELERSLIVERVRAGIRNSKAKGMRIGRPPLREFTQQEVLDIRMARRRDEVSVRQLAQKYGTTQWMINRVASA